MSDCLCPNCSLTCQTYDLDLCLDLQSDGESGEDEGLIDGYGGSIEFENIYYKGDYS